MNSPVLRNAAFAMDQCVKAAFEKLDEPTNWDLVIANAGDLDVEAMTAELKAGEPFERNELNALRVFRLQTKIRIAHRHAAGMPQYAGHTCGGCGQRPASPVNMGWNSECLYCEEEPYLFPEEGYRSYDDHWLEVAFDTVSQTWGIAYSTYDDRSRNGVIIVSHFENREAAQIACNAPNRFGQLYNRVCGAGYEVDESTILPVGELFASNLPFRPEQWRQFCETNFRKAKTEESEPFASEVRDVCRDFFTREH